MQHQLLHMLVRRNRVGMLDRGNWSACGRPIHNWVLGTEWHKRPLHTWPAVDCTALRIQDTSLARIDRLGSWCYKQGWAPCIRPSPGWVETIARNRRRTGEPHIEADTLRSMLENHKSSYNLDGIRQQRIPAVAAAQR